jgi:transcriptional regulator with XRE-family HTH domain
MYEPDIDPRLGQRIRTAREAMDMSQERLAIAAGLTRSSIANIELGNQDTTIRRLVKTARALGISPASLFYGIR